MLMTLMIFFLKLINYCIPMRKRIYFIPHNNCDTDKYDIINYTSDNVLSLFNYILESGKYTEYELCVEIDNNSKICQYQEYCLKKNISQKVYFLTRLKRPLWNNKIREIIRNYLFIFSSMYVFVDTFYYNFSFKKHKQKVVCLGYYTPFKDDYHLGNKFYENIRKKIDLSFDYHISTSSLSSRIISIDSGIRYSKFLNLGFPINYNLLNFENKKVILEKLSNLLKCQFEKIVLYTPTFRDYEKSVLKKRGLFGYDDELFLYKLSRILEKNNSVLLMKLHPFQNVNVFSSMEFHNIFVWTPIDYLGLYDIMAVSDVLITDYTSAYFDFLLLDKPVVFNFYDFEEYSETRGFSFTPIKNFCAGTMIYSSEELLNYINEVLIKGTDNYCEKRHYVNSFFNEFIDNKSSERICNKILL